MTYKNLKLDITTWFTTFFLSSFLITYFQNDSKMIATISIPTILILIFTTKKIIDKIKNKDEKLIKLKEIDKMTGEEFEEFLVELYNKKGENAVMTKGSHDQGGDLIVRKIFGRDKVVQAKRYSNKVGNKAVQEVVAAKAYYNCKKAEIYTNNFYTKSAKELAKVNNVKLLNREDLIKDLKKYKIKKEK